MSVGIQIFLVGNHREPPGADAVVVECDLDYVLACRRLRDGGCPMIRVRKRVHFEWLKVYCDLLGIAAAFEIMTPRRLLAESWNVTVPDWLTDEMVVDQDLLEIVPPPEHASDFSRTALCTLLGDGFDSNQLTEPVLVEVIKALTSDSAVKIRSRFPVLSACIADTCTLWLNTSPKAWSAPVCDEMQSNPDLLHRDLTYALLLGGYPERLLGFKLPPQQTQSFRTMDREGLRKLPLHPVGVKDSAEQIALFFSDIGKSVENETEFIKVLHCTSGILTEEFDLLCAILSSGRFAVSVSTVRMMQEHFAPGRAVSKAKLSLLKNYVVPPLPSLPAEDAAWGWPDWLSWISGSYLPYRHWQQASRVFDPEVEAVVARFSDWYLAEYERIHADPECSIAHALTGLTENIRHDELSVIFIVDCLPQTFLDQLHAAFSSTGFHRHESRLVCSLLPTCTEVCKPLLLTGAWNTPFTSYEKAVAQRAKQSWSGKSVQYFGSELNTLRDSGPWDGPSVLVLNYLAGDEMLHADLVAAGSSYEEELYRIYARLANAAKEVFARSHVPADSFGVYILTDHGATKLLKEETQNIDSVVVRNLFAKERHRFAEMDASEAAAVPENLWDFGYRFKQPFMKSERMYFVPRGHSTIRTGLPKGYVHGGATPEEVVVPVMRWRPVAMPWKPLLAQFKGLKLDPESGRALFYIQRMSTLRVEVQNPNAKPVDVDRVDILTPDSEVRKSATETVLPGKSCIIEIECSFGSEALRSEELVVQITSAIDGDTKTGICRTKAQFRSAMTGGFSLKDL